MNELTSPYLLMWSASLASCAVPVLFPPVQLMAKTYDGGTEPYMPSTRWVDGSVRSDFPRSRLSRLYNINYTIAIQVNPHVVPWMKSDHERLQQNLMGWPARALREQARVLSVGALDFARQRFGQQAGIRRMLDHGVGIVGQRYYGDINIIGDFGPRHYSYTLRDPKANLMKKLMRDGERATWPRISQIRSHAQIGSTLDACLMVLGHRSERLAPESQRVELAIPSHLLNKQIPVEVLTEVGQVTRAGSYPPRD